MESERETPREPTRQQSKPFGIYAVLAAAGLIVLVVAYGIYSQSIKDQARAPLKLSVPQEKVYIVAMSTYGCPCGSCDLVFMDCDCPLALKVQREVRELLARGATSQEIVRLLEDVYQAKKEAS